MSISVQTNTSIGTSSNASTDSSSQIARISKQIQALTVKLGKIASEEGMTPQQKKEKAALIQQQIESLRAELEQLLKKQAEKKEEDASARTDKKEGKSADNTIDVYV